jgi:DNA helicase-2/ATP-dependent DNA helicase PcrA
MAEDLPFKCPVVTDEDISRVTSLLGLPVEAFYGVDRKDPRQDVLKSSEQLDVAACPGSGKTTLLVAKLAILAEKWEYRTRGICVLSHTNVARNEIENKLGNSTVGRTLLGYPHFVGTIHSFVAEFLAIQWIRSLSYPVKLIDSEICESIRWKKLAKKWRSALEHRHVDKSDIRILDTNFRWAKKDGTIPLADDTDTYREYQRACEQTAADGFHCYDDMFVWALDMMAKLPWII